MSIDIAYEEAKKLLHEISTPHGFYAAAEDVTNYGRVWGRDGVVTGLAALTTGDEELCETFRQTLMTHRDHQDRTGRTPSNVDPRTGKVSYGTTVGRIDASLWYVIGVCQYVIRTGDTAFWDDFKESVTAAIFYLECLELNSRGLIYVPQGGDWADEYVNQGYVLFDQMLYYHALQSYHHITGDDAIKRKIDLLKNLITVNYFPRRENIGNEYVYHNVLFEESVTRWEAPLPLTYFSNFNVSYAVDNFANALILLSDIPASIQNGSDNFMQEVCDAVADEHIDPEFPILPAFHPVIQEGSEKWDMLTNNYLFTFRNFPNHYHNGGLWPLVHGFFLSVMCVDPRGYLETFADILGRDHYLFPEYYHGESHTAEGVKRHAFTASAYVIAYNAIMNGNQPLQYDSISN